MILLRAATVTVADLDRSVSLYRQYFDYELVESGELSEALAASWDAPNCAGARYAVMAPSSGREIYLRFVEQPPVDGFKALRSYGWNAIEICVSDVHAVHERVIDSPFEVIGPPKQIGGLANIHPMQVKGPDEEVVFLTQINADTPPFKLPRASTTIDQIFILVYGCEDLAAGAKWMGEAVGLAVGEDMEIAYTMLAKAYGKPMDTQYRLLTLTHDKDVFLELDQYPDAAVLRPQLEGWLPPGCAIGTFWHPDLDSLPGPWIITPTPREGPIYKGRRAGVKRTLDGALLEIVEG